MDLSEAVDIVVKKTGHNRYRDLTNPDHPDYQEDYIKVVLEMAKNFANPKTQSQLSLLDKAKNFIGAAIDHVTSGFQKVPDSEYDRRNSICNACEYKDHQHNICRQCGCFLPVKTSWASSECPIKKWVAYAPDDNEKGCGCGK